MSGLATCGGKMPVRIDAKGSKLSDSTKDHIEDSCTKLNNFFDKITDIEVILDTHPGVRASRVFGRGRYSCAQPTSGGQGRDSGRQSLQGD